MSNISGTSALREIVYIPAHKEVENKIRVAGYARVSTNSEEQQDSFISQVSHYTRLIENEPSYELVEIYADEGISGVATEKRTEFLRMMEDARNGKIDKIITKSLSRFSRNSIDAVTALRELKALGVSVTFEQEGMSTEKLSSENLLTIYSALAEQESRSISENCKKSIRARMSKGEYMPSEPPYGYRIENKQLIIYEPEATVIRRIFKEYLSDYGKVLIAKGLNEDNIPRKNGEINWQPNVIHYILSNERYVGDMLMQKTMREDSPPYKKVPNRGAVTQYYITNTHEPIVSRLEFEIVKLMLNKYKQAVKNEQRTWALSKKIKCSDCNSTYRRKTVRALPYWMCYTRSQGINKCSGVQLSETAIFTAFIQMYNKLKQNYKAILLPMMQQLERLEDMQYKNNEKLKDINVQIAELSEQNHAMSKLMSSGVLDRGLFISKTDELNCKIQKLKKSKALMLRNRNNNELFENTEQLIEFLSESTEYITEMDAELFDDLIEKITVKDENTLNFHLINGLVLTERIKS